MLHNHPVTLAPLLVTITVTVVNIIIIIILASLEQEGWMKGQANKRLQSWTERLAMPVQLFEDKRPDGSCSSRDHFRRWIYLFKRT
jgi:hypothetical protein